MTVHAAPGAAPLALAPASDEDFEALLSLRMSAMRESAPKAAALRRPPPRGGGETLGAARRLFLMSLQRLGRFDPQRVREWLSRAFEPSHTRHILQGGERVGFVVLLPMPTLVPDHLVLDHLYIAPQAQGQGIGSWVMAQVLEEADRLGLPVRVTALKMSDANRFYQRHGFELQHESAWDLHYLRPAADDRSDD